MDLNTVQLILNGKYEDARKKIDVRLMRNKFDGEAWFLKGFLSYNIGNNLKYSIECIEMAIHLGYNSDFVKRVLAYIWFEQFEFNNTIRVIQQIKSKECIDFFLISIAYLLLQESNEANKYLNMAYSLDKNTTKELLKMFYKVFVQDMDTLNKHEKTTLWNIILNL